METRKVIKSARKRFAKISWTKRIIAIAAIIAIGVFLVTKTIRPANKPQYQTAKAEKGTLVSSVSASGQLLSTDIVNITTSASGVVKNVFVQDGDTVKSGDKIAEITLDSAGQQQSLQTWTSYLAAKTTLDSANANAFSLQSDMFNKWKTFMALAQNSTYQNPDGSPNTNNRTLPEFHIAEDDWLSAEAKYKNQQAVITQAQADVSSKWMAYQMSSPTITAPIAGMVGNIGIVSGMPLGSQGSTVSVGTGGSVQANQNSQRVAVIKNAGVPIATFNISEIDITKVQQGQKATITLDAKSDKTFTGKVLTVDHIGAVTSGVTNYTILISLDTSAQDILPNMAASAKIITNVKEDAVLVPSSAVQTTGGQTTVRILKNGNPQPVQVEVGESSDTQTEITSGVNEGDTVVTGNTTQQTGQRGGNTSPFGGGGFFRGIGGGR